MTHKNTGSVIIIFREAKIPDIEQMMIVRLSVKENTLSNPAFITYKDMIEYKSIRSKDWVCEIDNKIIGFSICDLKNNSVGHYLFFMRQKERESEKNYRH